MKTLLALADAIDAVNRRLGKALMWLTLAMVLLGFANAALRYAGRWIGVNQTSNLALEAQWYMFAVVFLFLGAFALQKDAHVRVDLFYASRSPRTKAWINLIGAVVFLIPFCGLIVYVSWPFVAASVEVMETSPDPGGLWRWPLKLAIPAAFTLMGLQGLSWAVRSAEAIRRADPPADAQGTDGGGPPHRGEA